MRFRKLRTSILKLIHIKAASYFFNFETKNHQRRLLDRNQEKE
jgi:hypothetical protein